jgi:hypothetical protein
VKKLVPFVAILLLGWYGYTRYQNHSSANSGASNEQIPAASTLTDREEASSATFSCDGRKRCSQMRSCAEATYFLKNCPGVEMDGDRDGVPCESQWCGGGL